MTSVRKFEFGLSFDPPAARPAGPGMATEPALEVAPEPEPVIEEPPPPPEPTFSQAELDIARQQGWAEGQAAGEIEAMQRMERRLADTVERLTQDLSVGAEAQQAALAQIERQATEFALGAVRKLFPALAARSGTVEIEALIADALNMALGQPKLTMRCAPNMVAALEPIVTRIALRTGFEGRLGVLGDPALAGTECRIEWAEGGMDRDPRRLMAEIEAAVARGLADFDRRLGSDGVGMAGVLEESR